MAKASKLEQIYAWEPALQAAWQKILRDVCGIVPFATGDNLNLTPAGQDDPQKGQPTTPRAEVHVESAGQRDHVGEFRDGEFTIDSWNFKAGISLCTTRQKDSASLLALVAKVRLESQLFRNRFTEALLPFHAITWIQENATARGIDEGQDEDQAMMQFTGIISVRNFNDGSNAWPAV